jgi:hypothetical protein
LVHAALALLVAVFALPAAWAHEGHDHDKPAPLNIAVAPRVVAVTPELELVGVLSGTDRLTVFLHEFATNAPVSGARMTVSADADSVEAKPEGPGVFTVNAPWIAKAQAVDLIFAITLAGGGEDLLSGRLEVPQSLQSSQTTPSGGGSWAQHALEDTRLLWMAGGGFVGGVLLTLLFVGARREPQRESPDAAPALAAAPESQAARSGGHEVRALRRGSGLAGAALLALAVLGNGEAAAAEQRPADAPSLPSTMATDQPQRMPDGTLFIPKATQHLLSIRTQPAAKTRAPKTVELSGRVIVGPQNLGRVQPNRPGRFVAAGERVGYVGMAVTAGQILGYVETYIEAADRANIVSQVAETEARIAKNRTILSRYEARPGSVPQVKVDEIRGEIEALVQRREQLLPSTSAREPLVAPISGVISAANVVAGQVVDQREVLFEIIDPSEFWVEAVSPDPEAAKDLASAVAIVQDHHTLELDYIGRGLALRHHSNILNFRVLNSGEGISVGMTAKVVLQTKEKSEGFVLPASAVVRGPTGLPILWIKGEPERFEPQPVKVEPFDGQSVVVTSGLEADQRVVTEGVTLLNQVR